MNSLFNQFLYTRKGRMKDFFVIEKVRERKKGDRDGERDSERHRQIEKDPCFEVMASFICAENYFITLLWTNELYYGL